MSGQPKTKSLRKRIFLVGNDLVYNIYKQVQTYMVYVRFLEADLVYHYYYETIYLKSRLNNQLRHNANYLSKAKLGMLCSINRITQDVCDFLKGILSFSYHFQVFLFYFFVEVGS